MKTRFSFLLLALSCSLAFAQGTVNFGNNNTMRVTNLVLGTVVPANPGLTVGLYVGAVGSTSNQLTLVGTTTTWGSISSQLGVFSGGNPFTLPAPDYPGGTAIAFQIRVWSTSGGSTYEEAYLAAIGNLNIDGGASAIGFVTPASGTATIPALFGTGAGQVGAFVISYIRPLPEPASLLLGCLGGAALLIARRRK